MRKVLCVDGHFFNADQYTLCPKCGKPEDSSKSKTVGMVSSLGATIPMADMASAPATPVYASPLPLTQDTPKPVPAAPIPNINTVTPTYTSPLPPTQDSPKPIPPVAPAVEKPFHQPAAWLVCTKDTLHGLAFPCKIGRTFLSQTPEGDIAVTYHAHTANAVCATITFDPKKKEFHVLSTDYGDWLLYCNDDLLFEYNPKVLNAYDTLTISQAASSNEISFAFLPLCGQKFDWSEHPKEGHQP